MLRDDGVCVDLVYTSCVQLPGGDILIVYYYCDSKKGPRYTAGTICSREV